MKLQVSGRKETNMYNRLFILLFAALSAIGCSSPLEKSVLYPLEAGEIDKVVGEDNSFLTTYSIVEGKWNYISTPQDSARWKDLTYGRLHSYLKTIEGDELNSPLFTALREDWETKNSRNNRAVDSLLKVWDNFLVANSPDSLVSASFIGVETEKIRNIKKEIDTLIKAGIMIKALKGKVDSVSLLFSFSAYNEQPLFYFPFNGSINPIIYRKGIRDSVIVKVFPYMLPHISKAVVSNDSTVTFSYLVHSVYKDGKCYNLDSLKKEIPAPVLALLESGQTDDSPLFDAGHYREEIIRESIDPAFIPQSAYIKLHSEQYYRQIDSLAFSFANYRGNL